MSNRERAMQLLEKVPETKLNYIIGILEGAAITDIEEVEPDEWDLKMIAEAIVLEFVVNLISYIVLGFETDYVNKQRMHLVKKTGKLRIVDDVLKNSWHCRYQIRLRGSFLDVSSCKLALTLF